MNSILIKYKKNLICILICIIIPIVSNAQNISPQVIQQLRGLPSAQQQQIAAQYGIDLEQFNFNGNSSSVNSSFSSVDMIGKNGNLIIPPYGLSAEKMMQFEAAIKEASLALTSTPILQRSYEDLMSLPLYGMYLFDKEVSTFAPVDNIPMADSYILGVGDSLSVFLYGNENNSMNLTISRKGDINFPRLGSIPIAGLSYAEAVDIIESRVASQLIGTEAEISIGALKSINVLMTGEVKIPGLYSVSSLATVTQMLFMAGGITEIGSLRNIQIKRKGKVIATYDAYNILVDGDSSDDMRLQSGDSILVNILNRIVVIDGEVRRPGKYEFVEGDTISDLLRLAGGINNKAHAKRATLETYSQFSGQPEMQNLDLTNNSNKNLILNDGDVLRIASTSSRPKNNILLKGAFERPGSYGWFDGMRFSDIVDDLYLDTDESADLDIALIARRISKNSKNIKILSFNPTNALHLSGTDADPALELFDEVIILSEPDIDSQFGKPVLQNHPDEKLSEEDIKVPNDKIAETSDDLLEEDDLNLVSSENKVISDSEDYSSNSRYALLNDLVSRLRRQASNQIKSGVIEITGFVQEPGEYPLISNGSIKEAIDLAGGLKDQAYMNNVEVRRISSDNSTAKIEFLTVNLNEEYENTANKQFKLKSRDHVRVNSIKDWQSNDTVKITGEVYYPGEYLIKSNETLSSVLQRAGGLTKEAFAPAAVLTRESVRIKEIQQLNIIANSIRREMASKTMTKEDQSQQISEDSIEALLSIEVEGRLVIDMPNIVAGDKDADIILMNGDELVVPKFNNVVTVVGEVRKPGSFVRQDSLILSDYIDLAAGHTQRADKRRIYLIKPNGAIENIDDWRANLFEFSTASQSIRPGDTIVVPIKSNYQTPFNYYMGISQAVFQSLTSIFALDALLNSN